MFIKLMKLYILKNECSCGRYTMVPASLYLGFSASIIWVAEVQVHLLDLVRHFVVFDDVISTLLFP